MNSFIEHVVAGLAAGGIEGLLAVGLVLVHRASGVVNVAQGALATLSAFVCWTLLDHGWRFWPALGATILLSFAGGIVLERAIVGPARDGSAAPLILLTGVLLAVDGLDTWIWGGAPRAFRSPFSAASVHVAGAALPRRELGVLAVALAAAALVGLLAGRTKLGLGLRAIGSNTPGAVLAGIQASWLIAFAWGLAAALGATAAVLAAPSLRLDPAMMQPVLVYAFAAAVLGGIDSPAGAMIGGLVVGVLAELAGAYVHWVGGGLRLASVAVLLVATLAVRPQGVLGRVGARGA